MTRSRARSFQEGEEVFVKNYGCYGSPWLAGCVVELTGPVSVLVELLDGLRVCRHFDQIRNRVIRSRGT